MRLNGTGVQLGSGFDSRHSRPTLEFFVAQVCSLVARRTVGSGNFGNRDLTPENSLGPVNVPAPGPSKL